MFEYVNTSVPNGLLPGTHGFCAVAMTRDLPEPVRRRLESFSSYTHLATANGPDYLRLNPVSWSHLVLDGGEHVLGCVRAAPFDYTGRTNRLARFWFFQAAEVPAGLNPADAILQGGDSASLSDAWSGEPRWLAPRAVSPLIGVPPRSDARPAAWMQAFGESDGPRLAAAFSVLLAERIRAKGRPLVFHADPATHGDGSLLLSLFADLIALLPAPLRAKVTFSTYPVALSASTACHLRGEFGDASRLLAGETAWVDLRARRVHGAETAAVPPELLFLATHGYEQPPEPVIRDGSRRPAPLAQPVSSPAPSRIPRLARGPKPPVGRLIARTAAPRKKKPGFEDYLFWALLGALVLVGILLIIVLPTLLTTSKSTNSVSPSQHNQTTGLETNRNNSTQDKPKTTYKPQEEKPPVVEPTTPTNTPVAKTEPKKPVSPPQEPIQTNRKSSSLNEATSIELVKSFTGVGRTIREPKDWRWIYYEPGAAVLTERVVETLGAGKKEFKKPPNDNDPAVLLVDTKSGKIYWRWSSKKTVKEFENKDVVDARHMWFGKDETLFTTWSRIFPGWTESYQYSSKIGKGVSVGPQLKVEFVIDQATSVRVKQLELELKSKQEVFAKAKAEFDPVFKPYNTLTNEIHTLTVSIETLQSEINELRRRKDETGPKADKDKIDKQIDAKQELLQKKQKEKKPKEDDAPMARNRLVEPEIRYNKAKTELDGIKTEIEKAKNRKAREAEIRSSQFEILPPDPSLTP